MNHLLIRLLAAACAALLAGAALAWLDRRARRARRELAEARAALALRHAELQTLHAIGREIVSTVDPDRMFAIIERECAKVFDVAFFFVAILDAGTGELQVSYRSTDAPRPQKVVRSLGDDLASWVIREKRSVRVDDAQAADADLPFRPHVVDARIRSVLAAPLLVGDRVVGALSVQSRAPGRYEDHQLSVLQTMAQLCAAAVENARQHALARVDTLTGLPLRDDFFARAENEHQRAVRYSSAFAILMLDLDAFKAINDRHGPLAGDRYLRGAGAVLRDALRGADVACRFGGDEFCILLPETGLAAARAIAERLRESLARLVVDADGRALRTTVSIGIASFPEHGTGDIKGLMLRADAALYRAKRAGRDRIEPFGSG